MLHAPCFLYPVGVRGGDASVHGTYRHPYLHLQIQIARLRDADRRCSSSNLGSGVLQMACCRFAIEQKPPGPRASAHMPVSCDGQIRVFNSKTPQMLCSTHPFVPASQVRPKRRPATVLVTKSLNPTLHEKEADRCQGAVGSVDRPPCVATSWRLPNPPDVHARQKRPISPPS
jgi:hypothetical protein